MKVYNLNRVRLLWIIVLLSSLKLTATGDEVHANHATAPNIVVLFVDDLDFDETSIYDYRKFPSFQAAHERGGYKGERDVLIFDNPKLLMPNLQKLAGEGAVFNRFYVTSAVCTPARYSLLTGRYATRAPDFLKKYPPDGYGNLLWNVNLLPSEDNIARQLKQLGYKTGFFGKWHNGIPVGTEPGFVETREDYDIALDYIRDGFGFDVAERIQFANPLPHNLEWICEGALEFIDASRNHPFFMYVAIPVPHHQYKGVPMSGDLHAIPTPYETIDRVPDCMPTRASIYERMKDNGVDPYMAPATWLDDMLGALLDKLDEQGLTGNTLFFLISDHQSRGKFNNYEGARVPAVVRWPGKIQAGTRIEALCANIDIAPTLIYAAGGRVKDSYDYDGTSFLKVLEGKQNRIRDELMLEIHHSRALVTEKWKYIANRAPPEIMKLLDDEAAKVKIEGGYRTIGWHGKANWNAHEVGVIFDANFIFPHYFDADQLYDLQTDMLEQVNLANEPQHAETLHQMQSLLRQELQRLPHQFGEFTD